MEKIPDNSLFSVIHDDWIIHGKDWTKPGFRAVAVQRFGVARMNVKPKLLRAPLSLVYKYLYRYVRNHYGIELPYTVKLGRKVVIEHQHGIVIHGNAQIGDGCIIRQGVTIGNRYLDRPYEAPTIGNRVNIGAGTIILGNISIGDDVNIGGNSIIIDDIPAGSTVVSTKSTVIKTKEQE